MNVDGDGLRAVLVLAFHKATASDGAEVAWRKMAFKDLMKSDAVAISDPTVGHAEALTYWPLGVSANARTVNVFVLRAEPAPLPENPNVMRTATMLLVPIDATSGVATITPQRDKFLVPRRAGDATAIEMKVAQVLRKDHMFWTLEVVF